MTFGIVNRLFVRFMRILPALALAACGGPGWLAPQAEEFLVPNITADGSKFFEFRRDYIQQQMPGMDRGPQVDRNGNRPLRVGEFEVTERLQAIMVATGYCRDGFFELYREQNFQQFIVRGECREDATEQDRQNFVAPVRLNGMY